MPRKVSPETDLRNTKAALNRVSKEASHLRRELRMIGYELDAARAEVEEWKARHDRLVTAVNTLSAKVGQ
jgi:phage-related minor tail protein